MVGLFLNFAISDFLNTKYYNNKLLSKVGEKNLANESEDKIHFEVLEEKNPKDKLCEISKIKNKEKSIKNLKDYTSKLKNLPKSKINEIKNIVMEKKIF